MVEINIHRGFYSYLHTFRVNCVLLSIIDQNIAGIPGAVVLCHMNSNDLMATRKTDQEHISNLKKALEKLQTAEFHLKLQNC